MSKVNIKPLGARVLVEEVAAVTKTASGIIIPDAAQEKPSKATIVAVGNGTSSEKIEVSVGDTILYAKYAGTAIKEDGKDYIIINQTDILAIV
ncbi:MAG: co-chaperone GroES [Bacteroidales bacterium]|nr:co-chaperone GroES [Bacteroidales bacterium]